MKLINNINHIINSYNENKLSHAFLIESNNIDKCLKDVKKVIKIINCEKKYEENCEICNLCYQIDNNTLPSFIIVEPDGSSIKKEQIIELKEKMFTKPIYSKYNTYIIMNAEKLNNSSANTMLKFIEEPEENIIGFFITNNKKNIIDTIKSRCQEIVQNYEEEQIEFDQEKLELVKEYIKNIELDNKHAMMYNKNVFLEQNYTREEIIKIFKKIFNIYNSIYNNDVTLQKEFEYLNIQNRETLARKLLKINKTIENISKNGNINLILDSFVIEMR
ncbi:MAG: hypothetical protein E7158_02445 [Firmicutes bacterium]|nr:hypothetical protein [Bacillota bacterium]